MKKSEKNVEIIAEAIAYLQKGFDLLNLVERTAEPISETMPSQIGPWTCGEDLAYSLVKDSQMDLDGVLVHLESGRGLFAGKRVFAREAERYLNELDAEFAEDKEFLDLDEYPDYDPLVFPGDVPEEDMKTIRALAEKEREHAALVKRAGIKDLSDMFSLDEITNRKISNLMEEGKQLRKELLQGPLAKAVLDFDDDVADMRKMTSILLCLYVAERQAAEKEDREPDEDYYYAGQNLYKHAAVAQMTADDEDDDETEDWDDEDWDGRDDDE